LKLEVARGVALDDEKAPVRQRLGALRVLEEQTFLSA
jgi:hypothetical protein